MVNLRALAAGEVTSFRATGRATVPDGGELWLRATVAAVRDEDGVPTRFVAQLEDISAEREAEQELTRRALHDPLTGLANRLLLQERLEHALAVTARTGGVVALIYLDLNDFKVVNDERGHDVGDEVLARSRSGSAPPYARARRRRGWAATSCRRLRGAGNPGGGAAGRRPDPAAIAVPVPLDDRMVTITASVGVAVAVGGQSGVGNSSAPPTGRCTPRRRAGGSGRPG